MATSTERGRARQRALFDFLGQYPIATTHQLAALIWAGDGRLARAHLLKYTRTGQLRRMPHPLYRNGAYVYTRSERTTTHGQKALHHLAEVDFHLAIVRHLGRHGARVIPELPWAPGLIPDQTVIWRDVVWAVEHHLSGQFSHAPDYQKLMEEEAYMLCHWWRPTVQIGLLVVTVPNRLEHIRGVLSRYTLPELTWRVATQEGVLREPEAWIKSRSHENSAAGASISTGVLTTKHETRQSRIPSSQVANGIASRRGDHALPFAP